MALGYSIAVIIHRRSIVLGGHEELSVTLDTLEGSICLVQGIHEFMILLIHVTELGAQTFVQVKGSERQLVAQVGEKLGLTGTYIPKSYIEIYLEKFPLLPRPSSGSVPSDALASFTQPAKL